MPRFYFKPANIKDGVVLLDKKESHHAISVLRLKSGDVLELFDGEGHRFSGMVTQIKDGRVSVMKNENLQVLQTSDIEVSLGVSVIKPERMELLIQKACELGVFSIIPLQTQRSVVKLPAERWEAKIKRWEKIAQESCKQCGQSRIPRIIGVQDYRIFLQQSSSYDLMLIPTLTAKSKRLSEALAVSRPKKILTLIGPEGDFTPEEVQWALTQGAVPVSLGPLVLRSETAAMYLLSALSFYYREVRNEK